MWLETKHSVFTKLISPILGQRLCYLLQFMRRIHQKSIPAQMNSFDCGVFLCTYALYMAENTTFDFTQDDMPSIRKHMAFQLLSKNL